MLRHHALTFALLLFGVTGAAAGPEAQDMKLEDMGFIMRVANTDQQLERLRVLPPRTFVARTKNGQRYFLYADPDYCKCVFVGDEIAMKNYTDLTSPGPQAPMAIGPGRPTVAQQMIQEIDPLVAGTIFDGDILDY
jgi:hypothetical protein